MPATAPRFGRAPGAWPLLGHVVALQRRPLALLDSLPAHGDLVEIRLGPRPAYVVGHPALARKVLTDLRGFDRGIYTRAVLPLAGRLPTPGISGCGAGWRASAPRGPRCGHRRVKPRPAR